MDKLVSHLGPGEGRKPGDGGRSVGLCQPRVSLPPQQLRLVCGGQTSCRCVRGLCCFLCSWSSPPSSISSAIFGHHDDFVLFSDSGNTCLYHALIMSHQLPRTVISLIYMFEFCFLGEVLRSWEAVWLRAHGWGFRRSGFKFEFQHLLHEWSWVSFLIYYTSSAYCTVLFWD